MSIADWIEGLAPSGRYTFSKEDVRKAFPSMSATTVATSLHRAVAKGRVFSPCRSFYVVVPEEYRLWKAVPLRLGTSVDVAEVDKKWKVMVNQKIEIDDL